MILFKGTLTSASSIFMVGGGYGATTLLRYMARVLLSMKDPPPGLPFGRIIYLDCSIWKSRRVMQRRIAEELKLNHKTMAMFGEQDEEDDINGVDSASRDVIPEIATVINRTMRESRFMLFFINGSDEEIILSPFGIPEYHDSVIIWTYRRFDVANMSSGYIGSWHRNIRSNSTVLHSLWSLSDLTTSNLTALLNEEATFIDKNEDASTLACMREMDIDGFLYSLFIRAALAMTSSSLKGAKDPSSYWICDGVIQEGKAEEIINALYQKIDADYTRDARAIAYNLSSRKRTPYLIGIDDDLLRACGERPHRWIAIRLKDEIASKNKKALEDMQSALTTASSIILRYDKLDKTPCGLFDVLFKQCNNVRVLILARCSFSFVSPPFQHCYKLRFLELDHCTDDNNTTQPEEEGNNIVHHVDMSAWPTGASPMLHRMG